MLAKKRKIKKVAKKIVKSTGKSNLEKKAEIDKIFDDFTSKMNKLKQERDKVVSDFLDTLKEKHIEEIKKTLNY